jgi:hypothetical protein
MESAKYKEVPLEKLIIGPYNLWGEKAEEIEAVAGEEFSWGMNNKGFIGAFLAARRFYKTS